LLALPAAVRGSGTLDRPASARAEAHSVTDRFSQIFSAPHRTSPVDDRGRLMTAATHMVSKN
jgi:hypothetical protein